jgi:hypothetical protein
VLNPGSGYDLLNPPKFNINFIHHSTWYSASALSQIYFNHTYR